MQQTKLISLLKAFDKSETKQFELFLESAFFNNSKKLVTFYKLLISHYPDFVSPKLEKEKIYQQLHKESAYNDATMRELTASLLKLAKEFILHQRVKEMPDEASAIRYKWFAQRGLDKMSESELELRDDLLERNAVRDYEYYHRRWLTDYDKFAHYSIAARDLEHKLLRQNNIDHHIHSLNKYYLLRFFESYVFLLHMRKVYGYQIDPALATHIETLAAAYINKGDSLLDIYYYMYRIIASGEENFYFALKAIFLANDAMIDRDIKQATSVTLQNYCTQQIREGHTKFKSEIMDIFRFEVDHELMLLDGELSYIFYINVMTIGIDAGEPAWLYDFKEKYKTKLPVAYGEHVYNFCEAYMLFAHGKYDEALRLTTTLIPHNEFQKVDTKNLIACIQYELGMYDQLDILLDSYPHHVNGKPLVSARRSIYKQFTAILKKMMDLNNSYKPAEWKKLQQEIDETSYFSHRDWIVKKMAEMKARHVK